MAATAVRDFSPADSKAVNRLALAAFAQYRDVYSDWEAVERGVGSMAALAQGGRILVAEDQAGTIVGAVAYVPPHAAPRADFFDPEWAVVRMLVVDPAARGRGLGRSLTEACIALARSDGAAAVALHTSPVMEAALSLYRRLGFRLEKRVPDRFGVPYAVYLKGLEAPTEAGGPPAARIEAHGIVHRGEGVAVRVPEAAHYAGGDRFVLHGVADCELHVFVETESDGRARRIHWIQFEAYLPGEPERRYDYRGDRRLDLWGAAAWVRAAPADTRGPAAPGSDRERVMAVLERSGVAVPAEVLSVRLVRLLDDPAGTGRGRRELMLMYVEDLAPAGLALADFLTAGEPNALWAEVEGPLIERATAAFEVAAAG